MSVTVSAPLTITITIIPALVGLGPSTMAASLPPANAGSLIGAVVATTNPPGQAYTGVITLGGADAGKFTLSNGGFLPCNVYVGASDIGEGAYQMTLSAAA